MTRSCQKAGIESDWQTIESAPKDGTEVLICFRLAEDNPKLYVTVGFFDGICWMAAWSYTDDPPHWIDVYPVSWKPKPIPTPPVSTDAKETGFERLERHVKSASADGCDFIDAAFIKTKVTCRQLIAAAKAGIESEGTLKKVSEYADDHELPGLKFILNSTDAKEDDPQKAWAWRMDQWDKAAGKITFSQDTREPVRASEDGELKRLRRIEQAAHDLLCWTYQDQINVEPGEYSRHVKDLHPGVFNVMNSAQRELYNALLNRPPIPTPPVVEGEQDRAECSSKATLPEMVAEAASRPVPERPSLSVGEEPQLDKMQRLGQECEEQFYQDLRDAGGIFPEFYTPSEDPSPDLDVEDEAKAIYAVRVDGEPPKHDWDDLPEWVRRYFRDCARAGIEKIRRQFLRVCRDCGELVIDNEGLLAENNKLKAERRSYDAAVETANMLDEDREHISDALLRADGRVVQLQAERDKLKADNYVLKDACRIDLGREELLRERDSLKEQVERLEGALKSALRVAHEARVEWVGRASP